MCGHALHPPMALAHYFHLRDLHLLAISTRITELSYSISDIQTRIFGTFLPSTENTS